MWQPVGTSIAESCLAYVGFAKAARLKERKRDYARVLHTVRDIQSIQRIRRYQGSEQKQANVS
ncbi:uncharacterized protein BO88DRAFT_402454, partial [Aspergillus vadensis CBS 113365]